MQFHILNFPAQPPVHFGAWSKTTLSSTLSDKEVKSLKKSGYPELLEHIKEGFSNPTLHSHRLKSYIQHFQYRLSGESEFQTLWDNALLLMESVASLYPQSKETLYGTTHWLKIFAHKYDHELKNFGLTQSPKSGIQRTQNLPQGFYCDLSLVCVKRQQEKLKIARNLIIDIEDILFQNMGKIVKGKDAMALVEKISALPNYAPSDELGVYLRKASEYKDDELLPPHLLKNPEYYEKFKRNSSKES
jgi:hypothetical protein